MFSIDLLPVFIDANVYRSSIIERFLKILDTHTYFNTKLKVLESNRQRVHQKSFLLLSNFLRLE